MKFLFGVMCLISMVGILNAQTIDAIDNTEFSAPVIKDRMRKAEDAKPDRTNQIFVAVEQDPRFPGGEDALNSYIEKNIVYPPIAKENGINGVVYIKMIVNKDGSLSDFKIVRDIGGGCGQAALNLMKKMPKWSPGKNNGHAVRVYYTIPVYFTDDE